MKTLLLLLLAIFITTPAYCQTAGSAEDRAQIDAQIERIRAMGRADREPSKQPPELDVHDPSGSYFKSAEYQKDQAIKVLHEIIGENVKHPDRKFPAVAKTIIEMNAKNEAAVELLEKSLVFEPHIVAKVGSVGVLRNPTELRQRIGEGTALVEVNAFTNSWNLRSWTPSRVFSMELMMMRGMDFSAFVDGKSFTTNEVFRVTGTMTYNTALGGTKTVYVIEPIDDATEQKIEERYSEIEKEKERAKRAPLEARREHRTRTFSDLSGKFSVKAEYKEYKDGKVMLRRLDNEKVIAIPLSKLSDADRKWVSEELKWEREYLR